MQYNFNEIYTLLYPMVVKRFFFKKSVRHLRGVKLELLRKFMRGKVHARKAGDGADAVSTLEQS